MPGLDGQLGGVPFPPAALIATVQSLDAGTLRSINQVQEAFPGIVVVVAAEDAREDDCLRALRAGIYDVVRIPYNPVELMLRLEGRVVRDAPPSGAQDAVRVGDLEIDLEGYAATKNGQPLTLTRLELRLLYCLAEYSPQVASLDRLLSFGWDSTDPPDATILKTHISHLRKKLSEAGGLPLEIRSRQMIGYVLVPGRSS